jgi:hypothetical protein
MQRFTPWLVVSLVVAAGTACSTSTAVPKPQHRCTPYVERKPIAVCSELAGEMGVGGATTWRIWIEGSRRPIEIRVHNGSPEVVELAGGVDQVVRTSGGRANEIRLEMTSLRPGQAALKARPYSRDPRQEAARIAVEIAPRLASVLASFQSKREALAREPAGEAAAALLVETEGALQAILAYPELAALRDTVALEFQRARSELAVRSEARLRAARRAVALVANRQSPDTALSRIARLLGRLVEVSRGNGLLVDICVVSLPGGGASFTLYPPSYQKGKVDGSTHKKLNIYRGLYAYRAAHGQQRITCEPTAGGLPPADCSFLDLFYRTEPVFACSFARKQCESTNRPPPKGACR